MKNVMVKEKKNKSGPESPEFWADYADNKCECAGKRAFQGEIWDKAARDYDDLESSDTYMHQVETVLETLIKRGALKKEYSVFDIACGTGTYSIRMASHCKEVTALDVSGAMLGKLEEKKKSMGLSNIRIIQADWDGYEADRTFDLVFVSMTPLLRSMKNLDRMLDASSRFLAIVSWAGIKENVMLKTLMKEIMGKETNHHRMDIVVPFNYLYAKGYAPDLIFFHGCWERKRPWERQAENLLWQLELRQRLTDKEKAYVKDRVRSLAVDGVVTAKTRVRIGFMLIDKEHNKVVC